jgi:hypothetical protein
MHPIRLYHPNQKKGMNPSHLNQMLVGRSHPEIGMGIFPSHVISKPNMHLTLLLMFNTPFLFLLSFIQHPQHPNSQDLHGRASEVRIGMDKGKKMLRSNSSELAHSHRFWGMVWYYPCHREFTQDRHAMHLLGGVCFIFLNKIHLGP